MAILCDGSIRAILASVVDPADPDLINPASLDVRVGRRAIVELSFGRWREVDVPESGLVVRPGDFLLVETLERVTVPLGLAVELKLKSSVARLGWDHSLAFWVDPGWSGVLTMEVRNVTRSHALRLAAGMRFGQMIFHELDRAPDRPYAGRYQGATSVEGARDEGEAR